MEPLLFFNTWKAASWIDLSVLPYDYLTISLFILCVQLVFLPIKTKHVFGLHAKAAFLRVPLFFAQVHNRRHLPILSSTFHVFLGLEPSLYIGSDKYLIKRSCTIPLQQMWSWKGAKSLKKMFQRAGKSWCECTTGDPFDIKRQWVIFTSHVEFTVIPPPSCITAPVV